MNARERQSAILDILCRKQHDTIRNLAEELNVTRITIQRDIDALSCSFPIRTVRGRYGGGVYLEGDYRRSRRQLSPAQLNLLRRLLPTLDGGDHDLMKAVIAQFGPGSDLL